MSGAGTKVHVSTEKARNEHTQATPFDGLRRQIDHLLDDFQRGYWHLPFRQGVLDVEPFLRGEVKFGAIPAVDIKETDTGYEVTAELPGVLEKDVTVKFSDGTLTISAEKREDKEEKKANYFLSERHYGPFRRSFRVADGVETDKIEANFKNGVLQVTLPKTAEARKKTKTITIGKG
jgi:HSP20 family protein